MGILVFVLGNGFPSLSIHFIAMVTKLLTVHVAHKYTIDMSQIGLIIYTQSKQNSLHFSINARLCLSRQHSLTQLFASLCKRDRMYLFLLCSLQNHINPQPFSVALNTLIYNRSPYRLRISQEQKEI